ncbi:S1 family peptidase [Streptomyces thinghirensis]|nr:S1 family peptidase [Streptomyces thinghirensis]
MATIKKSQGTFKTFVSGGDAIFGGGARCSLGFNVTAGDGSPAFLTGRSLRRRGRPWSDAQDGQPIATVDQAVFPGEGDFALVKYDDPATEAPSEVNLGDQSSRSARPRRRRSGSRSSAWAVRPDWPTARSSAWTPPSTTTAAPSPASIQTDVCAEPGDSGGSLFTEDRPRDRPHLRRQRRLRVGGETFFQPVTTALEGRRRHPRRRRGGRRRAREAGGAGDQAGGEDAGAGDQAGGEEAGGGDAVGGGDEAGGEDAGAGDAGDGAGVGNAGDGAGVGNAGGGTGTGSGDGSGLTG